MHRTSLPRLAALAIACAFAASVSAGDAAQLTNADIVSFARSGFSSQLIIDRIQDSVNAFDVSTQAVIALKESGVGDDVIAAMLASGGRTANPVPSIPGLDRTLSIPPLGGAPSLARPPAFSAPPPIQQQPRPAMPALQSVPALQPLPPFQPVGSAQVAGAPAPAAAAVGAGAERFTAELAAIANGGPDAERAAVAWMLANRDRTAGPLREALKDRRPEMQAAAIRALAGMNDQTSIPAIRLGISSSSPLVRDRAAEALVVLNDSAAVSAAESALRQPLDPLDGFIRIVGYARLVRAEGDLSRILESSTVALNREAAAWALAQIGRPAAAAWPAIEAALTGDSDPGVRRAAAGAVAAFHDQASAGLLQSACRKDPEVRKVTLEGMADYPETVEFLVGVLNLGPEQIAADELESARASLYQLTGQNFGLDGQRWTDWYAQNSSRFAPPSPPAPAVAAGAGSPPAGLSTLPGLSAPPGFSAPPAPPAPAAPAMSGTARTGREVDIAQWGIVADPAQIPMAPEVDRGLGAPGPAALPPPPGVGAGMMWSGAGDAGAVAPSMPSAPASPAAPGMSGMRLPPPPMAGGGPVSPYPSAPANALPPPQMASPPASAPGYAGVYEGAVVEAVPYDGGYSAPPPPVYSSAPPVYSAPPAQPEYYNTITYPAPDPHLDVSGYGGASTYTDEIHSENYRGTADLVPDAPSFSIPTMADVMGVPETDLMEQPPEAMPAPAGGMTGAVDAGSGLVLPPPPGGMMTGADGMDGGDEDDDVADIAFPDDDDAFGLGEPMFDGEAAPPPRSAPGSLSPPPPGDEEYADEEYEEEEEDAPAGDRPRESVIVSGRVDASGNPLPEEEARPTRSARPAPGASVWVPEDDEVTAEEEEVETRDEFITEDELGASAVVDEDAEASVPPAAYQPQFGSLPLPGEEAHDDYDFDSVYDVPSADITPDGEGMVEHGPDPTFDIMPVPPLDAPPAQAPSGVIPDAGDDDDGSYRDDSAYDDGPLPPLDAPPAFIPSAGDADEAFSYDDDGMLDDGDAIMTPPPFGGAAAEAADAVLSFEEEVAAEAAPILEDAAEVIADPGMDMRMDANADGAFTIPMENGQTFSLPEGLDPGILEAYETHADVQEAFSGMPPPVADEADAVPPAMDDFPVRPPPDR